MKKIKFLFVLLFIVNVVPFLSARDFESDCMSFFKELGLLSKESQSVNSNKMNVSYYFYKESKEIFTERTIDAIDTTLFPNPQNITYKDIQQSFKDCKDIFLFADDEYSNFSWQEGKRFKVSIMYSQGLRRQMYASGVYVFRVFDDNMVYTVRISDCKDIQDRDSEYDKLDNLLVFKEGQKTNLQQGIEGNQGYCFKSRQTADEFYNLMKKKDKSLPKSALKFQEIKERVEHFILNYK